MRIFFLILALCSSGFSQVVPFSSDRWQIDAAESRVENYLDRESLRLKGGIAHIKDSGFTDGILEFDVAFSQARGFMGGVWRMQDLQNYEDFYVRPHQSGKPDANQYTPVFNGVSGWQLYHGEGYGAPVKYHYNEWIHVKIVVSGNAAEVYIDDMEKPAVFIPEQKREIKAGHVGLKAGNFAPAHFANFSFTKMDKPELKGSMAEKEFETEANIMSWSVSSRFDPKKLNGIKHLKKSNLDNLKWTKHSSEKSGVVNLARVQTISPDSNCVFVRVRINSEKDQAKGLQFGYSDDVKVFINSNLFYSGSNYYMSRDYRYLGTIGYFDEIFLPLKKGTNELLFVVTENFGGWGLQARFESLEAISIVE